MNSLVFFSLSQSHFTIIYHTVEHLEYNFNKSFNQYIPGSIRKCKRRIFSVTFFYLCVCLFFLSFFVLYFYRFASVCPQRLPNIANETAALEKMPKGRLEYLRRLLPYLQNQSEDCLYLNIYVPIQGKQLDNALCSLIFFLHLFSPFPFLHRREDDLSAQLCQSIH